MKIEVNVLVPPEVAEIYGKLPDDDIKAIIEAEAVSIGESAGFAFDCHDVENWEDYDVSVATAHESFDKVRQLLAMLKGRADAES